MKVVGIDQSLTKAAFVCREETTIVDVYVSRTGDINTKGRKKDVTYYNTLQERVHHVVEDALSFVRKHKPDLIVFEALSYGSGGNAERDLACLYGALREELIQKGYGDIVREVAPTVNKAFARGYLKKERQFDGFKKNGEPKLIVMDKKVMVEAIREVYGQDYLKAYNYSTGLDDLADATWLAYYGAEHDF